MIHIIHIIDNFFINLSLNDLGVCLENVLVILEES